MAITIRVFKRLVDDTPVDEVSYDGNMSNPAYFSVAVVPVSGTEYAPDEDGLTLYVQITSPEGEKGLDLKVRAEPISPGNPPDSVLDGVEAYANLGGGNYEWQSCYNRFVIVSPPGQPITSGTVIPVKLRIGAQPGDPIGTYSCLLHFIVYNIGT